MELVKVYTIGKVRVAKLGSYVQLFRELPPSNIRSIAGVNEYGIGYDFTIEKEVQQLPVWQVKQEDGSIAFIAVENELKTLLEAPFKGTISELRDKLYAAGVERDQLKSINDAWMRSYNSFIMLPWYKRVWRALTNNYGM